MSYNFKVIEECKSVHNVLDCSTEYGCGFRILDRVLMSEPAISVVNAAHVKFHLFEPIKAAILSDNLIDKELKNKSYNQKIKK